jgi:hypothetical protein
MLAEGSIVSRSASVGWELVPNGDAMDSLLVCGIGGIMICSWNEANTAKGRVNARRCDRRMVMRLVAGALELQAEMGDRKLPIACGQVIRS